MTSSTYGTAELQGEVSSSPPKPYMSRVAKIALALIACGAAAVLAHPGTRKTTTSFTMDQIGKYGTGLKESGDPAAPPRDPCPRKAVLR